MAEKSMASRIAKGAGDLLLAPGRAIAGVIDKNNRKKAEEKAKTLTPMRVDQSGKTATHTIKDVNGNIVANKGDPIPEVKPTTPATPTQPQQKKYTFQDVLNEVGEDPVKVREWLASHPGYKPGDITNKWLAEHPVPTEEAKPTEETPKPEEKLETTKEGKMEEGAKPASKKPVEDIIGSDNEQKKQVKKAAQSVWEAIASGEMDPQTGGYFLMDAIQKAANNRQRRDSNYIENLSRAANGDTILSYDIGNDEKSKYETMVQDPALERANEAAGIESQSNAQTSADLSTANAQQQYGEAAGPQGLAQTAATVSAMGGNFDTVANAFASGNEEEVRKALDTELQNPQIQTKLADLEKQLKEGTLDADIMAAKIQNSLSNAQLNMIQQQAKLLGFEGDLKSVLTGAIKNAGNAISSITGGGDIMANAGSLGMLLLLTKLGAL